MTIVKSLNDDDANTAPGVSVPAGSQVAVSFVVTNTGTSFLANVTVTDSDVTASAVSCPGADPATPHVIPLLGPAGSDTASVTCTATIPAPPAGGTHVDTGSVSGTPTLADGTTPALGANGQALPAATDTDDAHAYTPAHPNIVVEKLINDDEASAEAPGVLVGASSAMTLTFVVTNDGDVALAEVTVTDDAFGGDIVCGFDTVLAPGESGSCEVTLTAPLPGGTHVDTATATGSPVLGDGRTPALGPDGDPLGPVEATDTAYAYAGAHPKLDVIKRINGDDAATAPGISVPEGSVMTVTFDVSNTGDVRLDPIVVTDTTVKDLRCPTVRLNPGDVMTCTASLAAPAVGTQHTNTVTVTGTPVLPDGTPALGDDGLPIGPPQATDTAYAVSVRTPLPATGLTVAPLVATGIGTLLLGVALLVGSRRRQSTRRDEV